MPQVPDVGVRAAHTESDRSLWRSLAWVGGARWAIQLFTWASTLVVARLLAPSDYGIIGLASLYIGVVALIADSGLGSAVVTIRSLTGREVAQLNTLSGIVGTALLLLSFVLARPLGAFFNSPELPPVIVLMAVSIAIVGWQSVPDALLQNQLRFRVIAFRDTVRGFVTALVTIALAMLGFGYWALAGGAVAGSVTGLVVTIWFCRASTEWPDLTKLRDPISYSTYTLGSRLAWYGYSNSDFFVAGKLFSASVLGAYTLAWSLANISVDKVSALVGNVTPSFFAAAQDDRALLAKYLRLLTVAIALVSFPVSAGLSVVASDLIPIVLGQQWVPAVAPLIPLSLYAGFRSLNPLLNNVLRVTGDHKFVAHNAIASLFVMPAVFFLCAMWGPVGIAYGWVLGYPLLVIPVYRRVFNRLSITGFTYLDWLRPALVSTVVMAVAVVIVKVSVPVSVPGVVRLLLCVSVGVLTYAAVLLAGFPDVVDSVRSMWRRSANQGGLAL